MNISMIGQPEVSGCHWSNITSVGLVCHNDMKDWEAIVVNGGSTPIPTTFTVTMETVQDGGPICPVHCDPSHRLHLAPVMISMYRGLWLLRTPTQKYGATESP